jgi:hypothetical protein
VVQLGLVLSDFSDEIVMFVTSPKTGLQRRHKWPPTISEVLEACADHYEYLTRLRDHRPAIARLAAPSEVAPGYLANVFVPAGHPRYAGLVEWSKTADPKMWKFEERPGIWVNVDIWNKR